MPKKYIPIIILGVILVFEVVNYCIDNSSLEKNCVYVLGRITYNEKSSRGDLYRYNYFFGGSSWEGRTTTIGRGKYVDDLILVRIDTTDPKTAEIVNWNVPQCVTLELAPSQVWLQPPSHFCK